jgi:hypothetical protein
MLQSVAVKLLSWLTSLHAKQQGSSRLALTMQGLTRQEQLQQAAGGSLSSRAPLAQLPQLLLRRQLPELHTLQQQQQRRRRQQPTQQNTCQ